MKMRFREASDVRDGMRIEWDIPIEMDDGVVLRCDVYRPLDEAEKYPVLMTYGPYGKWLHFEDLYGSQWRTMCQNHPDVPTGSTNKYQSWEVVDPEKWVPEGYICVRVDSRGAGRSGGVLDLFSAREARDFALCIEWAGSRSWCNGRVGLNGISYYAINQWHVAALRPKHLAAICAWEGAGDLYRDMAYHGGIFCNGFVRDWSVSQVYPLQNGRGTNGYKSRLNGDWVSGPNTLTQEELNAGRRNFYEDCVQNNLQTSQYWRDRAPDWAKIEVPLLSSANWGGQGLHPRGNFEGFIRAASQHKWLEVHGLEHWSEFYTDYGLTLQKRFFGHFLKDKDTGWAKQPKVQLQVRHPGERFVERHDEAWPLSRTNWTKYYLRPAHLALSRETPPQSIEKVTYEGLGDGVTFLAPPVARELEITGPVACRVFVSSASSDADLFLIVRVFSPDMKEIVFRGALDPHTPVAQGWLRASHRKLDPNRSQPYAPYHTHDEIEPLRPGEIYQLDIEIWPTSIVVPAGHRIGLTVRGRDYVYGGDPAPAENSHGTRWTGVGPFKHDDPIDRPAHVFRAAVTLHSDPEHQAYLLLPVIEPR